MDIYRDANLVPRTFSLAWGRPAPKPGKRSWERGCRDAKRRGIYPPLFTDPEGYSCFSIYQIKWIKKAASLMATISSSGTFAKRRAIYLSVRKAVNIQGYAKLREPIKTRENCYPLIWQILNVYILDRTVQDIIIQ